LGGDTQVDDSNIDFFHISRAFTYVKTWFEEKKDSESTIESDMHISLGKKVQIIWYEVNEEESEPVEIFARLNIGKIPLRSLGCLNFNSCTSLRITPCPCSHFAD
jgi:hypothetical protein